MTVYLIHFQQRYKHAGHYLGYSANVNRRMRQHQSGYGVPLMRAVNDAGIPWQLVRTWDDGDMALEKRLRHQNNNPRFCPLCSASSPQSSRDLMKPVKKPATHCDKYGHNWVPSPVDGYEVCTNNDYRGGKLVPCPASRKQATGEEAFFASTTKPSEQPVVPQQSLW
jgi:predicted GIY-YIG superfamily endonuclease